MLPKITGLIDRRVLLNYRAPVDAIASLIPSSLQPRLVGGFALIGVCMIRFKDLRPEFAPKAIGLSSENCAHRISVQWEGESGIETGVFVYRRDTDSTLVKLAGGRIFPGVHGAAGFDCSESDDHVDIRIYDDEGDLVRVNGKLEDAFSSAVFDELQSASDCFEKDKVGYSPSRSGEELEAIELNCHTWQTRNLRVTDSFVRDFSERDSRIVFDHALIMHNIEHHWIERDSISPC